MLVLLTSAVDLQAEGSQAGPQMQQPGAIRGYGVVNTPAFTPGPEQSPLMTWGDIGSTPVRLDQEDDIHVSTSTGVSHSILLACGWLRCSNQFKTLIAERQKATNGVVMLYVILERISRLSALDLFWYQGKGSCCSPYEADVFTTQAQAVCALQGPHSRWQASQREISLVEA